MKFKCESFRERERKKQTLIKESVTVNTAKNGKNRENNSFYLKEFCTHTC